MNRTRSFLKLAYCALFRYLFQIWVWNMLRQLISESSCLPTPCQTNILEGRTTYWACLFDARACIMNLIHLSIKHIKTWVMQSLEIFISIVACTILAVMMSLLTNSTFGLHTMRGGLAGAPTTIRGPSSRRQLAPFSERISISDIYHNFNLNSWLTTMWRTQIARFQAPT